MDLHLYSRSCEPLHFSNSVNESQIYEVVSDLGGTQWMFVEATKSYRKNNVKKLMDSLLILQA